MVFSIVLVLISKFHNFIFDFSVFNEEASFSEMLVKVPSVEGIANDSLAGAMKDHPEHHPHPRHPQYQTVTIHCSNPVFQTKIPS